MTKLQRVRSVLAGAGMLFGSYLILRIPEIGYLVVMLIIALTLIVKGLGMITYFFTMARYMVGGRMILYKGLILADLGLFTFAVSDIPKAYVLIYLTVTVLFAGVIDVLRALEARKLEDRTWKEKFLEGMGFILLPLISILFADSAEFMVIAYAVILAYGGLMKIAAPFRRTAVISIPE